MSLYGEWATENCDPNDMFDEPAFIVVGNTRSIECPNCRTYRRVDQDGYVEKCPECKDDEWNLWEEEGKP